MYRHRLALVFVGLILLGIRHVVAVSFSNTTYALDLTKPENVPDETVWAEPNQITMTTEGLGWGNRPEEGSRDFWLQTAPIGVGESWRPTSAVTIRAKIVQPANSGLLYVRYSADQTHWTTWQALEQADQRGTEFQGIVRVPNREQADYQRRRMEYARRDDIPWRSDEEALATEILKHDRDYFAKNTPFVGYVQFLYEGGLEGGQRLKGCNIEMSWILSGKHHPPKIKGLDQGRDIVWRFKVI